MTIIQAAVLGITAVALAVQLKPLRQEYSVYLILAAGLVIGFLSISRLELILDTVRAIGSQIRVKNIYLGTLLKMVGITYIAEFASGICQGRGIFGSGDPGGDVREAVHPGGECAGAPGALRNSPGVPVMRRQKKALRFFLALALFLFMFSGLARAEEAVEEPYALEDFNMEEIQRFLDSLDRDQTGGLSFGSVMKEIMDGNLGGVLGELAGRIREGFFSEIRTNARFVGQIILLAFIGAVFSGFSNIFGSGHVSETGFYVVYLLNMVFLAASFFASVTIAGSVAEELMEFMRVLLPAYFLAVAMAGGAFTSTAVCGFTFGAIGVVQAVVSRRAPSSDAGLFDAGVSREPLQGGHDLQDHRAFAAGDLVDLKDHVRDHCGLPCDPGTGAVPGRCLKKCIGHAAGPDDPRHGGRSRSHIPDGHGLGDFDKEYSRGGSGPGASFYGGGPGHQAAGPDVPLLYGGGGDAAGLR